MKNGLLSLVIGAGATLVIAVISVFIRVVPLWVTLLISFGVWTLVSLVVLNEMKED